MDASKNKDVTVIRKNDPDFPPYLDFEVLRKEGIRHLGDLSGKIWTDHNVHDPGITILEMLCYALIDLGYRTQLPIEDLLGVDQKIAQEEDNFFSPAELLTCNPVTILDYRKLIIDTPGIRNAWLEINNEKAVYLQRSGNDDLNYELNCIEEGDKICLNGLYNVHLELERTGPICADDRSEEEICAIVDKVKEKLHQYRNLGEDFVKIHVLCQEEIALCGRIELTPEADPEKINLEIYLALNLFLSPEINFYTLKEMLDKGKTMEEIYAGKTYHNEIKNLQKQDHIFEQIGAAGACLEQSYGFIDEEELEAVKLPKELHLSDIYALISCIEGVKSVQKLTLKAFIEGIPHQANSNDCGKWVHHLAPGHVPVFCPERSCFDFTKAGTNRIKVDFESIRQLYREGASITIKAVLNDKLDQAIPKGRHLTDLGDYYSIQNEFPRNYGIGEGGLSSNTSDQRKAQALQLKGYLLFYDQLLTNYLGQLSHLRELFSFLPDSQRSPSQRRTYFGGTLDTVPQIDQLVRFYTDNFEQPFGWVENTVLALPVSKNGSHPESIPEAQFNPRIFNTPAERQVGIYQLQREFKQGEYQIDILPDECGYIFTINTSVEAILLHSKRTYKTYSEAQIAAMTVTFLATLDQAYRPDNDFPNHKFSFELVFKPIDYVSFLQTILEEPEAYCKRRNDFLDHLLARFAESFTDYSVLVYGFAKENIDLKSARQQEIEAKGQLLQNYPLISRNRGRAFNYLLDGWNTLNISGLERRVAALSGIEEWKRQHLCNFEIHCYADKFNFEITDQSGSVILRSLESYTTPEAATEAVDSLVETLKLQSGFSPDDKEGERKFGMVVRHAKGAAVYPGIFNNRESRDRQMVKFSSLLRKEAAPENILVTKYIHRLELLNFEGKSVKQSRKQYDTLEKSTVGIFDFAKKIGGQLWVDPNQAREKMELVKTNEGNRFLNVYPYKMANAVTAQYRWVLQGEGGKPWLYSTESYQNEEDASLGFARFTDFSPSSLNLETSAEAGTFSIQLKDTGGHLMAHRTFENEQSRNEVQMKLKQFISSKSLGEIWINSKSDVHAWEVWDGDEALLQSQLLYDDPRKAEKAAAYAQTLPKNVSHWEIARETDESFRLVLKDKYYIQAVSVAGFATVTEAQSYAQRIQEVWNTQGIIITEGEDGYAFNIPQKEGGTDAVFSSYSLYRNKHEAFQGIAELLARAKRKTSYYPSGDDANLNFSFLLQGAAKHFLAHHPFTYSNQAERDKVLNATIKILKQTSAPFTTVKEFIFEFTNESGEVLLRSTQSYPSEDRAKKAYLNMLPVACSKENFEKVTSAEGYSQILRLRDTENNAISAHPYDYVKWEKGDEIIKEVTSMLHPHRYLIAPSQYPYRWKYFYYWETPQGDWSRLLESTQEYHSEEEAGKDYGKFLGRLSKVRVVEESDQDNKRLAFKFTGVKEPFAYHTKLMDPTEAKIIKKAAKDYLRQADEFQKILSDEAINPNEYIHEIPGREGGNYVYRMVKKDQFMAYHPCECGDEPLDATCERLFGLAQAGYQYLDICLGGDITCLLQDKKYHFALTDKETHEVYFKSYQGYDTKKEAETAFADQYLQIIDAASNVNNYGTFDPDVYHPILTEEQFDLDLGACSDARKPLAVVDCSAFEKYGLPQLADLACSYPIRIKRLDNSEYFEVINGKYHFLVQHHKTGEIYFKSYLGYESEDDAKCAFEEHISEILEAACIRDNYGSYNPENAFKFLTDELYDQEFTGDTEPLVVVAASAWSKFGLDKLVQIVCKCPGMFKTNFADDCLKEDVDYCYYFHLVGNPERSCKLDWKSERCWDTPGEAREAFRLFLNLLKFKGNYHSYQDVDNCCCYRLVIREVLLESCSGFNSEGEAWVGLDHLLKIVCEEGTIHSFWDEEACINGFHVVDPDFYVAIHPYCYYHPDQAKEVIGELIQKCLQKNTAEGFLDLNANQTTDELQEPEFTFTISDPKENTLWASTRSYDKEHKADAAAWKTLALSERSDFYGPQVKDQIALYVKNKNFEQPTRNDLVALHPSKTFTSEQLIEQALGYPCRKEGDYYYYQFYCADFEVLEPDENPESCEDGEKVINRKLKKVKGAVVWKSKEKFSHCNEVQSAYQEFCQLLEDSSNYEIVETGDCDKYQIVLTNPDKVLACHPQYYTSKIKLNEAINRVKKCADLEGMHLVEHILLRPAEENCECFLPVLPDPSCRLPFDLFEDDPCVKPESNNEQENPCETYIPGTDPYSFWVTVVLPCWTKRFRRAEFREVFQDLLRKEAPAHIALNIVWVGPRQMCKFEEQYRDWLRWLSCKERCNDADPYCEFINCLSGLLTCQPDTPEDSEECACNSDQPFNRTNLMINYAFTANREEVYDKEFIDLLGFKSDFNFSLSGNVVTLPKGKFGPIFPFPIPPIIDPRVDIPVSEVLIESTTTEGLMDTTVTEEIRAETLIPKKIEQNIRRRLAGYSENLKTIGDSGFKRTEAYERTKLFLSSSGDSDTYQGLMEILAAGRKRARSKKGKERYLNLMQEATGYFMDQQVVLEKSKIPPTVRQALKQSVKLLGKESPKLVVNWKGEEWKTWRKAKAVNAYLKLFKLRETK